MSNHSEAHFPAFHQALSRNHRAVAELPAMTFWRYTHGVVPAAVRWLMRHPELMRALAEDAEQQARNHSTAFIN